jgi:hypothetical protein
VPYKFSRNPNLCIVPCTPSPPPRLHPLPRVKNGPAPPPLCAAASPCYPTHPPPPLVSASPSPSPLAPCCSCPCAASAARRRAPPCAACRPVLPCAAPPAAVPMLPYAHTRTPPAPVRPLPSSAAPAPSLSWRSTAPLLQPQPPCKCPGAQQTATIAGTEQRPHRIEQTAAASSSTKFDRLDVFSQ